VLELVSRPAALATPPKEAAVLDHERLLSSYFQSYRVRNFSPKTIDKEKCFLESWFREHGDAMPLLTWQAMEPVAGRKRVTDYANTLLTAGIRSDTVRSYLGTLRRYFSYVLEFPFVGTSPVRRIQDVYGPIDQPVTEYDMPRHVYNGERLGVPLDPERLGDFFASLREHYLGRGGWESVRARNYTLAVVAGESGLRIDELLHLELNDLFFESKKIQTRFAKGTHGSGKRARQTLFTPFARDTVSFYLKAHRPRLYHGENSPLVFLSPSGEPLRYSVVHQALGDMVKISQKAKFPVMDHMSWHWFRRIFATRFIETYPNRLAALISLLGHTTPNTVHAYIRHSEAWMDSEIQKVLEGKPWQSTGD
jgi:integrase